MQRKDKKFNIISSIEDDAPFGDINWCTISFITPNKINKTKYLDVIGFKVHNGYTIGELANNDAKKIKESNENHDVYISQIGKLYSWDDATKSDVIEYDNDKLNELEKTRRENVDKIKLMNEQFKNEYKTIYSNYDKDKLRERRRRIQKKLYDSGRITRREYELMQEEENKSSKEIKEIALSLEEIDKEMNECNKVDYLDENDPVALKYGCITIFSPKQIGGLKTLCFKIRGIFQTVREMKRRITKIRELYPNDKVYTFEVGKWCPFSEKNNIQPELMLKQLNYAMKCHLDNMKSEIDNFEKRKDNLLNNTETESKITKEKNRQQKRMEKRIAMKKKSLNKDNNENTRKPDDNTDNANNPQKQTTPSTSTDEITSFGKEDDENIRNILDYLDDPETKNKYSADDNDLETMEMNVK